VNVKYAATLVVVLMLAVLAVAEAVLLTDTTSCPPVVLARAIATEVTFNPRSTLASADASSPSVYEVLPDEILCKVPYQTDDHLNIQGHNWPQPAMPELHPKLKVLPISQPGK
jgi:hypothetical protein